MKEKKRIQVILVSGFLGSGKTTLLKQLVARAPEGVTPLVLMNEFGEASIDGTLIRDENNPVQVVEINRGSIFCACAKGDFIRALDHIAREMAPQILIVEASGIADTTDMERDLINPRIAGGYELTAHLCLIDAEYFLDWLDTFNAVERQIQAAQILGITKSDLVDSGQINTIHRVLKELNPTAKVINISFGLLSWADILSEESLEQLSQRPIKKGLFNENEIETAIAALLDDPKAHISQADSFVCQTFRIKGTTDNFSALLAVLPEDVIRAKGFFRDNKGRQHYFDVRGKSIRIFPAEKDSRDDLAVFIRTEQQPEEIPELLARAGLEAAYLDE